ncbi:fasciclin-1 isoform X2 [Thrips palmi]|uniref:Fasciclin-1 isoform X2 n=1 Tax=Thrips palmi TaxID=161013 RepID=A0A6P8ZRL0_THRPL|nr:fasciclin-1 isoform X2 [Thrips palmi]
MQAVGVLGLAALLAALLVAEARIMGEVSVQEKMRMDADLSEFSIRLASSTYANSTLMLRPVTVFAPINMAFQQFPRSDKDESLVLYHITNQPMKLESLTQPIVYSQMEGSPPLWITHRRDMLNNEDVFVNNAKIDKKDSDYSGKNSKGHLQVLHKIDEVLQPVRLKPGATSDMLYNPNAMQLISQSGDFDLDTHTIRSFAEAVSRRKVDIFNKEGRYTFFVPVDSSYKHFEAVDKTVIEGHVIPGHVLFTAPTPNEKPYATVSFSEQMQVTISFTTDHKKRKTIVKSNTVIGDEKHPSGVVMAEVIKANIPVRNGVVHLIDRPLMVIDATVQEFVESFKDREDGPLYEFQKVLTNKVDSGFLRGLGEMKNFTLFAPSNEAWKNPAALAALNNRTLLNEVIRLHIVDQRLPLEHIKLKTHSLHHQVRHHQQGHRHHPHQLFQVRSMSDPKNLYFNVMVSGSNHTLTVEGGGVNATVIQPDIAATNGIIHIIDRVLGIASHTVKEKLATDPSMLKTYHLGETEFNDRLKDNNTRFTYFVPRDVAWHTAEIKYPSAIKKLFMSKFKYHAHQILERHLVVASTAYTMMDIKRMTHSGPVTLHTVRDKLELQLQEKANGYYLKWQNEEILVHRADVECTNGIIHVLDGVFLKESDIRVTAGVSGVMLSSSLQLFVTILAPFLFKWVLG